MKLYSFRRWIWIGLEIHEHSNVASDIFHRHARVISRDTVLLGCAGYMCGILSNPLAAYLARRIEGRAEKPIKAYKTIADSVRKYKLAWLGDRFEKLYAKRPEQWTTHTPSNKATDAAYEDYGFVRVQQARLGPGSREAMVLSKMHCEVTLFCQLAVLGVIFCVLSWADLAAVLKWPPIISIVYCTILAFSFANRRVDRAKAYDVYLTVLPVPRGAGTNVSTSGDENER